MKIGIITFHWGTNYGAVIQAYAQQEYLKKIGHDVSIINYRPERYKKTLLKCFLIRRFWLIPIKLIEFFKEKKIEEFREHNLNETVIYSSLQELQENPPKLEVYICGSDQIWNPSFTTLGEGKTTTAYYLDFGESKIKRLAYAVSFGCDELPQKAADVAKNYTQKFSAISVRENSGLKIVKKLGYPDPIILCDPTLLLTSSDYSKLFKSNVDLKEKTVYNYILREKDKRVDTLNDLLSNEYIIKSNRKGFISSSMPEWLSNIRHSSLVVTNSFHGMVFAIIFKRPFIVVGAENKASEMNGRFTTLLNYLDLEKRFIYKVEPDIIRDLKNDDIDWLKIQNKIDGLRQKAFNFYNENLNG